MYPKNIPQNISLYGNSVEQKRQEILEYFLETYNIFEKLFDIFVDDSVFYEQPEPLRHPMIFYYGHTASFFINKLIISKNITTRINPDFEKLFAIGVDEMSWDDLNEQNYDWPSVKQAKEYRKKVKDTVVEFIKSCEFSLPIDWESPMWIILMGIEHERIHIETSSVLHRQLDSKLVKEDPFFKECTLDSKVPQNELLEVEGGQIKLGKSRTDDYYGWDNEYGSYQEEVKSFKASKYLASNSEFLEFVKDGGYEKDEYWCDEGRAWKDYKGVSYPPFWIKKEGKFFFRTLTRVIPLPLSWPVEVNYLEAKAFCNYKSKKTEKLITLPSEAMWYRLYEKTSGAVQFQGGNIGLEHFASSTPVDQYAFGDFYDVVGNVWQWTSTPIDGFEGFEVHPAYDDFSTPTFDNRHNLIKGGSWASTGNETLKYSRYAFRRHFYQHAGFRYVEVEKIEQQSNNNFYETDTQVSQYCDFHFGDEHYGLENFHKRCANIAFKYCDKKATALDIGCSVGRGVFELAQKFEHVTGIDFSARFIKVGQDLLDYKTIGYERTLEGDIKKKEEVSLSDLGLEDIKSFQIEFWQGDACNLKPQFKGYDLIISINLIDRLYDPKKFLEDMAHRLNSGGVFIIGSPFTWSEEYTPKEDWLCTENKTTQDGIDELLSKEFEPMCEPFLEEFVIRETQRKFQHSKSQISIWKKK
jgi:5-histidylcysteine sulfoxide synthase/putative 4-mercaptohistidine N1-methyltranferase